MGFPLVLRRELDQCELRFSELEREYQNYRRRNAEIREQSYHQGGCDALKQILPVFDNLQRALEQSTEDEAFRVGIEMTMNTLKKQMEALGVEEIPAMGQTFDPNLHEAAEHIIDPEQGEGVIIRVMLTGFRRGEKILRHSLVVVAN